MSNECKIKKVGICMTVIATCIVLAGIWIVLTAPETTLAKKPDGGGKPEIIHGTAEFQDSEGDAIQSDTGDPYVDAVDFTELGLGGFFRLSIQTKKDAGRTGADLPRGYLSRLFPHDTKHLDSLARR